MNRTWTLRRNNWLYPILGLFEVLGLGVQSAFKALLRGIKRTQETDLYRP